MECDPTVSVEIVIDADPAITGALPRMFEPSINVTVPVAPAAIVAVNVSALPKLDGLIEEVRLSMADALLTIW